MTAASSSTIPFAEVLAAAESIVLGKAKPLRLALACLIARGHLLIEDLPGMGKTTLAHTLAKLFGLGFARVQFTSDLLPADILGVSVFDRAQSAFVFHPGPIFTEVLLADEINRATPKTQSALLEAMEERQVSIEGVTRPLPDPFFVIATQNPITHLGTFPLPESQLDRFLMKIELGYPDRAAERRLLAGGDSRQKLALLAPLAEGKERLQRAQREAAAIHVGALLLDYIQALLDFTRQSGAWQTGLSPRAGLSLLAAARAWAYLDGRDFVMPEDIQVVLPAVTGHRLLPANPLERTSSEETARRLIEAVPVP
ncbi:MAG: AAA family ATPase [Rhodocyclaceae bacterium]|nr:AAA family ATPase [Rhodocyclaceae bacterium]